MKVTAVTKFKHGLLLDALRRLRITACELADKCGISRGMMCRYVSLQAKPGLDRAIKILSVLAQLGEALSLEDVWPEEFQPTGASLTVEQSAEIAPLLLSQYATFENDRLLAQANPVAIPDEIKVALESLPTAQQAVLNDRADGMTWDEIAKKYRVSRERVRQYHNEGLHRIRNRLRYSERYEDIGINVTPELLATLAHNPREQYNAFEPKDT